MESYHGHVRTQLDAILLFEACRQGIIPRIRRRLSERERLQIGSGCVFIWDEQEAGMRRWTDSKSWSASRVTGTFLTYQEMDGNRQRTGTFTFDTGSPESMPSSPNGSEDGYKYKINGLYKQSFSINTSTGLKLHLISYYTKNDVNSGKLIQPTMDPNLKNLHIPIDLYPDTPAGSVSIPAVTNTPLGPPLPAQMAASYHEPPQTTSGHVQTLSSFQHPVASQAAAPFYSYTAYNSGYFQAQPNAPAHAPNAPAQPLTEPLSHTYNSQAESVGANTLQIPQFSGGPGSPRTMPQQLAHLSATGLLKMPVISSSSPTGSPGHPINSSGVPGQLDTAYLPPYKQFSEDKRALSVLDKVLYM